MTGDYRFNVFEEHRAGAAGATNNSVDVSVGRTLVGRHTGEC
jgi:hypothetical protein